MSRSTHSDKGDPSFDTRSAAAQDATVIDFNQPEELVGQRLEGRFLIEKNLTDDGADAGGIGVVYLAKDLKLLSKKVVVKILKEKFAEDDDLLRKFQHEKEALIRLDHPGIVRILDSGTLTAGNPFLVIEFIEGHSLRKALSKVGRLPLDFAAHVISSIGYALAEAHSRKILHRDIKPENIMLTPQDHGPDRVRLIDFGIARVDNSELGSATMVPKTMGTLRYMAPEQLSGQLILTSAADIFAFGVVAYEVLTGELPFKAKNISDMYHLEEQGVRVLPSQLRPDLPQLTEALLLSALEFDQEKRPQDVRIFGRDLARSLLGGNPGVDGWFNIEDKATLHAADSAGAPEPTKKKTRSLPWVALGLVILAALSVAAGYLLFVGRGPAGPDLAANTSRAGAQLPATSNQTAANVNRPDASQGDTAEPGRERELSYFLTVQKMRNGKPFEAPFKSSGQEIFESGYKFTMAFVPDGDGYMYVFNQGKDDQGKIGYYLLFPTPSTNKGSAQVSNGQQIETARSTFTGGRGTEVVWMIWTKEKSEDLERVTRAAVASAGVVMDEASAILLEQFLEQNKSQKTESTKDSGNQRTLVKAKGDTVVHRFELEHR